MEFGLFIVVCACATSEFGTSLLLIWSLLTQVQEWQYLRKSLKLVLKQRDLTIGRSSYGFESIAVVWAFLRPAVARPNDDCEYRLILPAIPLTTIPATRRVGT